MLNAVWSFVPQVPNVVVSGVMLGLLTIAIVFVIVELREFRSLGASRNCLNVYR